jgi:hypothetical protein
MPLCLQFVAVEKLEALGVNKGVITPHAMSSFGGPVRFVAQGGIDTIATCCTALLRPTTSHWLLALPTGDLKKCKDAGFHTCEALLMNTKKVSVALQHFSARYWAAHARPCPVQRVR